MNCKQEKKTSSLIHSTTNKLKKGNSDIQFTEHVHYSKHQGTLQVTFQQNIHGH